MGNNCKSCYYSRHHKWSWENNYPGTNNIGQHYVFQVDVPETDYYCNNTESKYYGKKVISSSRNHEDLLNENGCADYTNKYKKIKEKMRGKQVSFNYEFPTEKQVKTMMFISLTIGEIFNGRTKTEASQFIDTYLEIAKKVSKIS